MFPTPRSAAAGPGILIVPLDDDELYDDDDSEDEYDEDSYDDESEDDDSYWE